MISSISTIKYEVQRAKMVLAREFLTLIINSAFWLIVLVVCPFFVPKGPNRQLIQLMLAMTAVCCWLFWVLCYLHQLNPLVGPQLHNTTLIVLQHEWK
ncbi:PREDICTED: V-type proton ATPase subunit e-like [Priapulus caudatus]|uniref:V-type proton ATPase subunit e-like n=1 Tax=Priapulus caudatus TaxID=37621 RepID=A0ABM1EU34_PRICU|nr:PREDICTED: V-type proton ATPase subunit e-like [Priapulus caudatus]